MTLSNAGNLIPYLLWWSFDLLPLQRGPAGGNVISADLFLTWLTVMRIKCTCKHNLGSGGGCRRNTQQEPKDLRCELSPCVLTLRSVIKDTNQSWTPEASATPLSPRPAFTPPSSFTVLIQPLHSHFLGSALPAPLQHITRFVSVSPLLCLSPPLPQPLHFAHATQLCQMQLT